MTLTEIHPPLHLIPTTSCSQVTTTQQTTALSRPLSMERLREWKSWWRVDLTSTQWTRKMSAFYTGLPSTTERRLWSKAVSYCIYFITLSLYCKHTVILITLTIISLKYFENRISCHYQVYICFFSYFISKGAIVDRFGGDLNSTPLHWATR